MSQPVQFRTSPPVDAHKPGRSLSPPPKLFHASVRDPRPPRPRSRPRPHPLVDHLDTDIDALSACSPRKRHRPPHRLPRPCLDFEKMQQVSLIQFFHCHWPKVRYILAKFWRVWVGKKKIVSVKAQRIPLRLLIELKLYAFESRLVIGVYFIDY